MSILSKDPIKKIEGEVVALEKNRRRAGDKVEKAQALLQTIQAERKAALASDNDDIDLDSLTSRLSNTERTLGDLQSLGSDISEQIAQKNVELVETQQQIDRDAKAADLRKLVKTITTAANEFHSAIEAVAKARTGLAKVIPDNFDLVRIRQTIGRQHRDPDLVTELADLVLAAGLHSSIPDAFREVVDGSDGRMHTLILFNHLDGDQPTYNNSTESKSNSAAQAVRLLITDRMIMQAQSLEAGEGSIHAKKQRLPVQTKQPTKSHNQMIARDIFVVESFSYIGDPDGTIKTARENTRHLMPGLVAEAAVKADLACKFGDQVAQTRLEEKLDEKNMGSVGRQSTEPVHLGDPLGLIKNAETAGGIAA